MPWTHLTADICRLMYLLLEGTEKDQHGRAPSVSKSGRRRKGRQASAATQKRRGTGPATAGSETRVFTSDSGCDTHIEAQDPERTGR